MLCCSLFQFMITDSTPLRIYSGTDASYKSLYFLCIFCTCSRTFLELQQMNPRKSTCFEKTWLRPSVRGEAISDRENLGPCQNSTSTPSAVPLSADIQRENWPRRCTKWIIPGKLKQAFKNCCSVGNCERQTWEAERWRLKHLESIKTTGQDGRFGRRFIRQAVSLLWVLVL